MITKKIKTALDEVGIPCYFITRGNNPAPCVVYNYNEKPKFFADNEEKAIQYTVLLNLYCNNNIENTKKLVLEVMQKYGFIKTAVQSTILDGSGFFNTPIQFKICLRS